MMMRPLAVRRPGSRIALPISPSPLLNAVFYLLDLEKELEIQPRFFGPKLQQEVERRLRQEVRAFPLGVQRRGATPATAPAEMSRSRLQAEGTCDGQYGFILAVVSVNHFGKGKIREGVGSAVFNIQYKCIAFMPHKGEVLDVVVSSVNKARPRCSGPPARPQQPAGPSTAQCAAPEPAPQRPPA